jgi:glycosyltransferase involved in cell wall biosynthesis
LKINLPDLKQYRHAAQASGVELPLRSVVSLPGGLLKHLPEIQPASTGWPWTEQVDPVIYQNRKNWPKLTIVTPSYNQGCFIEQTIRAVLLQNYPNLEYIIIDGGSTDETVTILKKYSNWVSYWVSEKDRGQGHAINKGFSLASGEYYAWINSDDYYLSNTFFKVMTAFTKTQVSFLYGYAKDYMVAERQYIKNINKIPPFVDYLIRFPALAQPSCFWNAKIHQPIWEELNCAIDYELWLRIVKGNTRLRMKTPLSVANIHMDAKTADPKMQQKWHQDHLLICSEDAHGPALNWNRLAVINRIRNKLYKWLGA